MTAFTHDTAGNARSRVGAGLLFGLLSSASFGLSGALAKGLLTAGWTPGAAVTARILIAAAVMVVPAVVALRGRWHLMLANWKLIVAYGALAVAGCQFAYFNAIETMPVGVALLIEFTSPVAVVLWLWVRNGERPGVRTAAGAVVAGLGLVLVLDLVSGADADAVGILWALGAMAGAAVYWILSGKHDTGLPAVALAAGGLLCGGIFLALAGAVGAIPFVAPRVDVDFVGSTVPWWVPIVLLGVVTAAAAYVLGIAASRRLGSRLASFVGLAEVVAALIFAWALLAETPAPVQLAGGALILLGVVVVKSGETIAPTGGHVTDRATSSDGRDVSQEIASARSLS